MPGPGYYDSKIEIIKQNLGKITIGKEKRINKSLYKAEKVPGPGTYDAPASLSKAITYRFAQGSRTPNNKQVIKPS